MNREGPALRVRGAAAADLPALTDIHNHYVRNSAATFDIEPFTIEQRRSWFDHFAGNGPYKAVGSSGRYRRARLCRQQPAPY